MTQPEPTNPNKIPEIKKLILKIDVGKIAHYLQKHPQSKTLKQIIRYSRRAYDNEEETFRLAVLLAYRLDAIVNKADYVKNEKEKEYWLSLSRELFANTVGIREQNQKV